MAPKPFGQLELCGPVSVLAVEWITPSIHLAEPCRAMQSHAEPWAVATPMRPVRLWCDLCDWDRGRFSESQSIPPPNSTSASCPLTSLSDSLSTPGR